MCKILKIPKSSYYAYAKQEKTKDALVEVVISIFTENKRAYGTRRIKFELAKIGYQVSRRRVARIMKDNDLISLYTHKKYKKSKEVSNSDIATNIVDRTFNQRQEREVIVSDLTYVRVSNSWNYICIMLDLFNREIVGFSVGRHKDSNLVHRAFATIKGNLSNLKIFHTDRGAEFKNHLIDGLLKEFEIQHSLSAKGCPYDNAVAEAQFKVIKTEFVNGRRFESLEQLKFELSAYVHWFNNKRIHSALGYKTPLEFKQSVRQKNV